MLNIHHTGSCSSVKNFGGSASDKNDKKTVKRLQSYTLKFMDHQSLVDMLVVLLKKRRNLEGDDIQEYFRYCGVVRKKLLKNNFFQGNIGDLKVSKYVEELEG